MRTLSPKEYRLKLLREIIAQSLKKSWMENGCPLIAVLKTALGHSSQKRKKLREEEEKHLQEFTPWHLLAAGKRAYYAVSDLARRLEKTGDPADADCQMMIAARAIKALDSNPKALERMREAKEWPSMVPGGPESGPLRKAWLKHFNNRRVGESRDDIPQDGKVDFTAGKPARFAADIYEHLEELRRSGPDPVYEEMQAAGAIQKEPAYAKDARRLPPLALDTVNQWRDLGMASLESKNNDWEFWLQRMPDRIERAAKKQRNGTSISHASLKESIRRRLKRWFPRL